MLQRDKNNDLVLYDPDLYLKDDYDLGEVVI